jgi:hypothetical protein
MQFVYTFLYYVVLAVPFYFSGLATALLLTRAGREVNRLYAADLLGAGLGCAVICGVIPTFGGSGTVIFAGALGVLAALAFSSFQPSRLTLGCGVTVVGLLALAFAADRVLPIRVIPDKVHPLLPVGGAPVYTEWNSFSRIDVYDAPTLDPERPEPGFRSIIIDSGTAGTGMDDLHMGVRNFFASREDYRPPGLPYVGRHHSKVLIIGSGAGREVLEALYFGACSITAVEINPIINNLVTNRMRGHWGGLFEQPEVHLVTEDGRSYVRRSRETYDAIISINTMSDAAVTSGALGLSESYIMTLEAFRDYWDHLAPTGRLLVTGYEVPKLVSTVRTLFDRLELGSPANHVFAFQGTIAPFGRMRLMPGLLLQKVPLKREEVDAMARRAGIEADEQGIDGTRPQVFYSPFHEPRTKQQRLLSSLVNSPDLEGVYASSPTLLRPATDDKPFFFQKAKWTSPRIGFRGVLAAGKQGNVGTQPVAEVTLVVALLQALLVSGVLILVPLFRFRRQGLQARGCWTILVYFAGLGMGFILVEIVLLQRLQLFIGQPIYTYSVVLAGLLIFTGAGSYIVSRVKRLSCNTLSLFLIAVLGVILLTFVVAPGALKLALGLRFPLRIAVCVLLIAPLGIFLGMPFSAGLRLIATESTSLVPWAWGINAFCTVIGSIAAVILGMTLGFNGVIVVATLCYAAALMATRRARLWLGDRWA